MDKKKDNILDFNIKLHIIGRLWTLAAIILFLAIPVVLCIHYNALPNWKVLLSSAVITPFIIYFVSGILEPAIYSSVLGTNGTYLAFITGNLSNLKIPCVVKAQDIVGTKVGTEEHELVSTIAVATSTLVTALIIGVFVLLLSISNLQKIIEQNAFIQPAFGCVVYALFGSLGGKYIVKNPKLALIPGSLLLVISVILGVMKSNPGSTYLMIGIAVCLIFAIIQYKNEKRKQAEQKLQEIHIKQIIALEETKEEE